MKQLVTFQASGEITWTSIGGKQEERRFVRKGTALVADKVTTHFTGLIEIWQGKWSVLINRKHIRLSAVPHAIAKLAK